MKNIVFIPNIKVGDGARSISYQYSINSWKHFCDKHNCELLIWEDLLFPVEDMKITWQRYYLFDILKGNNIDYDQILMVDADTIVHPDCPNFFEETDHNYCGVMNDGCYEWVTRSIRDFNQELFTGVTPPHPSIYINGGFQIVNKKHKKFFSNMKEFYSGNKERIQYAIDKIKAGTDQTIVNYMLEINEVDVKILPACYNLQDLFRKNLLHIPGHSWWPDTLEGMYSAGWVYHFNAIPQNERHANYWIERTYKELYR
jgi:lipopolysaccharide biosynthesis glycosyltransferase|tara:strand:- start:506 stop:1276 length:771 start_codon:yes stop_codon:yes gene_type:complete